ncbi:hypothetical protein NC653_025573 [Populus alba x Populus x berolinensis]|uniref:Uncharacterized protein n=1 Tax=Populus alba x Populus x berolinensis TaxID=444605 RepID=A0AAD6MC33_9ROSI|nr:hypothetical protein NC653_025573 [Populus alba x Populus x berolinensis]
MLRTTFFSSLAKIEHRSLFLPPRQVDGATDSWKLLFPDAAASFSLKSLKYNIDEILEHQPNHAVEESNHHHHNLLEMSPHNSSCHPPQAVNFMQFLSLLGLEHLLLNTHRGDFIPVDPESSFSIFY